MKKLGKRRYSPLEAYSITHKGLRAFPLLRRAVASGVLKQDSKERIMLAVTQVNHCAMCSFAHTQMALESGMSQEEIAMLLSGEFDRVPLDDAAAIMFAQHYAECRGIPDQEVWERIQREYGKEKAQAILCAIQVIMLGNTYGIVFGSLKGRCTHHPEAMDERSSLAYELGMLLSLIVILPLSCIHAILSALCSTPLI